MTNNNYIMSPVGRIVSGSCLDPQTTDAEGNTLIVKNGPNAGQPRTNYYVGVAILKTDPSWPTFKAAIDAVARAEFPALFDPSGNCLHPQFAFKITDGDSQVPNSKGKMPRDKIGFAGHWVVHFSNGFAPSCYMTGGSEKIIDSGQIKRGHFIRVYANVKGNSSAQQPGIYLNHSMIEFVAFGEVIAVGPDPTQVFSQSPAAQLPAGASKTPLPPATALAQPHTIAPVVRPATDFLNPPFVNS